MRQVGATLHRGARASHCRGLSLSRSIGSRGAGSVIMAHGPSCSAACGIFPDQGSNPCPLHWQADSQPLRHQGSPHLLWILKSAGQIPGGHLGWFYSSMSLVSQNLRNLKQRVLLDIFWQRDVTLKKPVLKDRE